MNTIFKAYDIRGTYPDQLDEDKAYQIGKAFVSFLKCEKLIIGQDMRVSSPSLVEAFTKGANEMGADVIQIGQVCTDATYFASGTMNLPAVMFTASHNPPQYNGMKFSKAGAVPMNSETGLHQMKEIIESNSFHQVKEEAGSVEHIDVLPDYIKKIHSLIDTSSLKKLKIVVDAGNGMAGKIVPLLYQDLPIEIISLFFELDGNFPNHLADPSKSENLKWLQDKVKEEQADFGMAFDGDADRIFFVDEHGNSIPSSLITSLIAKTLLQKYPNSKMIHSLVCSHVVKDTIKKYGGTPIRERVGHSFIKHAMRENDAVFGGEHSAHYYYKDFFFADSGMVSSILLCEVLSSTDDNLSHLLEEFKTYHTLEEESFTVDNKEVVIAKVKEQLQSENPVHVDEDDGLTIEFEDWWCNVRPSNTEPLLRLNMEANSQELLEEKKALLTSLI